MRHVPRNTEGLLLSLTRRRRSGKTTSLLSTQHQQLITIPAVTLLQAPRTTLTGYSPRPSSISSLCLSFPPPPPTRNIVAAAAAGKMTMSTSTDAGTGGKGSSAHNDTDIHFGPFKVNNQVFLRTAHSFALVNLKPLLPGHVLVCPLAPYKRLTDLSPSEITDLFSTVQVVQRMLGRYYFHDGGNERQRQRRQSESLEGGKGNWNDFDRKLLQTGGSFNIAVQDGPEAGQTVGHVHVHVIPRIRNVSAKDAETPSDELYEWMAEEKGNVGGALWDRDNGHGGQQGSGDGDGDGGHGHLQHSSTFGQQSEDVAPKQEPVNGKGSDVQKKEVEALLEKEEKGMAELQARPKPGGSFPSIEDAARTARGMEEMEREAAEYRKVLEEMGLLSV